MKLQAVGKFGVEFQNVEANTLTVTEQGPRGPSVHRLPVPRHEFLLGQPGKGSRQPDARSH